MNIKVLGSGCQKCKSLERAVREVVNNHGIEAEIEKVEDIMDIMNYGVMVTPALMVDDKVVVKGRVPSSKEILEMLKQ